jgi:hypothetical protein
LGVTDVGIIMFRRMLEEQMQVVADGGEPMNVHRDPVENEVIVLPCEYYQYPGYDAIGGPFKDYQPGKPDAEAELSGDGMKLAEWAEVDSRALVWGADTSGMTEQVWFSDGGKH